MQRIAPGMFGRSAARLWTSAAMAGAVAAAGLGGCASAQPYNPAGLDGAQLGRVEGVCQSVMGLWANEPPIPGPGDPRLDPLENHYQGCVASLSGSLRSVDQSYGLAQADRDCRGRGLASGGPDLAQCVLETQRAGALRAPTMTAVSDERVQVAPRSFYSAGPHEESRREEMACARLGLNPVDLAFDNCVKDLKDTFYAIDNPQN
jgi:hypothetical protein